MGPPACGWCAQWRSRPLWRVRARRARPRSHPPGAARRRRRSSTPTTRPGSRRRRADPRILTELVDHMPASDNGAVAAEVPRLHPGRARQADLPQGHRPLPRGARQGVAARDDVQDRQERRGARHGRASRSPTRRRSSSSTSTSRSPRSSPIRASCRTRRRSSSSRPASRSTTRRAASTRRSSAAPRC